MDNPGKNFYHDLANQISAIKKEIELILYANGIYDWPWEDSEFKGWLDGHERIGKGQKEEITEKMERIISLKKRISERFNSSGQ